MDAPANDAFPDWDFSTLTPLYSFSPNTTPPDRDADWSLPLYPLPDVMHVSLDGELANPLDSAAKRTPQLNLPPSPSQLSPITAVDHHPSPVCPISPASVAPSVLQMPTRIPSPSPPQPQPQPQLSPQPQPQPHPQSPSHPTSQSHPPTPPQPRPQPQQLSAHDDQSAISAQVQSFLSQLPQVADVRNVSSPPMPVMMQPSEVRAPSPPRDDRALAVTPASSSRGLGVVKTIVKSESTMKPAVSKPRPSLAKPPLSLKAKREQEAAMFPKEMLVNLNGTTSAQVRKMSTTQRELVLFKRKLRNRESARRSRQKRQTVLGELQAEVDELRLVTTRTVERALALHRENKELRRLLVQRDQRILVLEEENDRLKRRMTKDDLHSTVSIERKLGA